MSCKEMREQRATMFHEARSISDPGTQERAWQQIDRLGERIEKEERRQAVDRIFADQPASDASKPEHRAYDRYIRRGPPIEGTPEYGEFRALSADKLTEGGAMVAPEQAAEQVIAVLNTLGVRNLATKFTVPFAESLGVPSVDTEIDDADWTTEIATGSEDSALKFGKRELHPHPIAKRVKASGKLIRRAQQAERVINERLAYKFSVTLEKGYLTGDGAGKPLGLFTASAHGISTGRDISAGNTSAAITMDGLINAMYSVKSQYLSSPSCRWLFHRDAVKAIRLLRDESGGAGTGPYLWQPSTQAGQPDTLLGIPVISSEYVPATFTTGLYVGLIGDLSFYYVADALSMTIQRLNELYAATDEVGFIGRMESDGQPALEEAFARVKLA